MTDEQAKAYVEWLDDRQEAATLIGHKVGGERRSWFFGRANAFEQARRQFLSLQEKDNE